MALDNYTLVTDTISDDYHALKRGSFTTDGENFANITPLYSVPGTFRPFLWQHLNRNVHFKLFVAVKDLIITTFQTLVD